MLWIIGGVVVGAGGLAWWGIRAATKKQPQADMEEQEVRLDTPLEEGDADPPCLAQEAKKVEPLEFEAMIEEEAIEVL